jgi:tRNA G18 (ribose-2'-O)-methylase SpoU
MEGVSMPLFYPDSLDDPGLADYRNVPDPELLRLRHVFVAEGRLVVRALLASSRFHVRSLLVTARALDSLRDVVVPEDAAIPIFVAPHALMSTLVGYNVHRGCLAIGERPRPTDVDEILRRGDGGGLVVVLERVGNADNMGGVFRNGVAFGADGVLLSPGCCDPLYRKAIRVSIGGTLRVPFALFADWPGGLRRVKEAGFTLVALTPDAGAVAIDALADQAARPRRLALVAGAEGAGLSRETLASADVRVSIPMAAGSDSLNVATAVAIALHRFSDRVERGPGS